MAHPGGSLWGEIPSGAPPGAQGRIPSASTAQIPEQTLLAPPGTTRGTAQEPGVKVTLLMLLVGSVSPCSTGHQADLRQLQQPRHLAPGAAPGGAELLAGTAAQHREVAARGHAPGHSSWGKNAINSSKKSIKKHSNSSSAHGGDAWLPRRDSGDGARARGDGLQQVFGFWFFFLYFGKKKRKKNKSPNIFPFLEFVRLFVVVQNLLFPLFFFFF